MQPRRGGVSERDANITPVWRLLIAQLDSAIAKNSRLAVRILAGSDGVVYGRPGNRGRTGGRGGGGLTLKAKRELSPDLFRWRGV